jgi:hypothetical protein
VLLAQAHIDNGDPKKALVVGGEVARQFPDQPVAQMLSKAVCAQAHQHAGNVEEAASLMADVERAMGDMPLADSHKLLIARTALATGRLEIGQGLIESIARNNTDRPLVVAAALRAAQGTAVEEACQSIVERAGADVQQALRELQQAKRDSDFARAIEIGEAALQSSPGNFTVQMELCTLYLVAMGRLGQAEQHGARAHELLALLDERQPNHTRVAAAKKFYRERLAASGAVA